VSHLARACEFKRMLSETKETMEWELGLPMQVPRQIKISSYGSDMWAADR
jgi:hypothetical protein